MASPVYRFGDFRLDPACRELRRHEEEVSLPPKAFGCLAYLVEHRDRAIGRDELIDAVWGKENLADSVLGHAILATLTVGALALGAIYLSRGDPPESVGTAAWQREEGDIALLLPVTVEPGPQELETLSSTTGSRRLLGAHAEAAGTRWSGR